MPLITIMILFNLGLLHCGQYYYRNEDGEDYGDSEEYYDDDEEGSSDEYYSDEYYSDEEDDGKKGRGNKNSSKFRSKTISTPILPSELTKMILLFDLYFLEYFLKEFHGKQITMDQIEEQEKKYAPKMKPFDFTLKKLKKTKQKKKRS